MKLSASTLACKIYVSFSLGQFFSLASENCFPWTLKEGSPNLLPPILSSKLCTTAEQEHITAEPSMAATTLCCSTDSVSDSKTRLDSHRGQMGSAFTGRVLKWKGQDSDFRWPYREKRQHVEQETGGNEVTGNSSWSLREAYPTVVSCHGCGLTALSRLHSP